MSLVDTACVGQISSLQLASMAPCTSIYQFIFLGCYFLSATTTNLVAANRPDPSLPVELQQRERDDYNERVVSCASLLAVVLGTCLAGFLFAFSDPLLSLAGCTGTDMLFHGRRYLLIRALGLPFVLVATVLQGASLGCHDALTPLKIFASAGILNLVGDVFLTLQFGWGVSGAAIATTASQAAAAIYYVFISTRVETGDANVEADILTSNATRSRRTTRSSPSAVRLVWKGPPSRGMIRSFIPVAITMILREIGNMAAYSQMTRAAAGMGAVALAAHQVTLQVWWLLSYIPHPMNVAAQTLVARDMNAKPWRVPKLAQLLYGMSLSLGFLVAGLTGLVLTVPALAATIVADAAVRSLLHRTAPFAMLAQLTCCIGEVTDGVCVGSGDFGHLPISTISATLALAAALRYVSSQGFGVAGVWLCSNLFFVSRFLGHLLPSQKVRRFLFSKRAKIPAEY